MDTRGTLHGSECDWLVSSRHSCRWTRKECHFRVISLSNFFPLFSAGLLNAPGLCRLSFSFFRVSTADTVFPKTIGSFLRMRHAAAAPSCHRLRLDSNCKRVSCGIFHKYQTESRCHEPLSINTDLWCAFNDGNSAMSNPLYHQHSMIFVPQKLNLILAPSNFGHSRKFTQITYRSITNYAIINSSLSTSTTAFLPKDQS